MTATKPQDLIALEEMLEKAVDRYSLRIVLEMLSWICGLKAAHLRETWQDDASAETWEKTGDGLDRVASRYNI